MTNVGEQLGSAPGPDEATLLAWVEGTADAAQFESVRQAMAADPALLTLLEAMKADRERLEFLGDLAPPGGLVAGALARYDAEMSQALGTAIDPGALSGIAGNEIHEVRVSRPLRRQRAFWSRERGLLAAAAAVALVSGLAWLGMQPNSDSRVKNTGVVASGGDSTHRSDLNDTTRLTVADTGEHLLAHGPTPVPDFERAGDVMVATVPMLGLEQPPAVPLVLASVTQDPSDRWIRAAREGRLAVRVTARRADAAEASLVSLISNHSPVRSWRVTDRVPDAVKIALAKPPPPVAPPKEPAPIVVASGAEGHGSRLMQAPLRAPSPAAVVVPPSATDLVCVGAFSPTASALEALRGALTEQVGAVSFVELSTPLVAASGPAAQTPESVLWWTQPASRWTEWVEVPVIVER